MLGPSFLLFHFPILFLVLCIFSGHVISIALKLSLTGKSPNTDCCYVFKQNTVPLGESKRQVLLSLGKQSEKPVGACLQTVGGHDE